MVRRCLVSAVGIALMIAIAGAQDAKIDPAKMDARAVLDTKLVLQAVSRAMGGDNVKTIQISGSGGYVSAVGQNYYPTEDWPKFEVKSYAKTIDYEARTSREQITHSGETSGRVFSASELFLAPWAQPGALVKGEVHRDLFVADKYAWSIQGDTVMAAPADAELRQLDIWLMSPHGFLKAALAAANPTAFVRPARAYPRTQGDRPRIQVSFTMLGKYHVNGFINEDNLIDGTQTWVANPVLGDMLYETEFRNYRDIGGIKYPSTIHQHNGDGRPVDDVELAWHGPRDAFNVDIKSVQVNGKVEPIVVPANVRQATLQPPRVESQKLADGVWYLGGGPLASIALEFRDFATVVEAPLDESRSIAVINEVHKLIPHKPIKYVVMTHHHFDHIGGLRTYIAEGSVIITQAENRDFLQKVFLTLLPRTIQPDRMSIDHDWMQPVIEEVNNQFTLTDGSGGRVLELYHVHGLRHHMNMLLGFLPREKILIEADMYNPPAPGTSPLPASPGNRTLYQKVQQLKLDVSQIAAIDGRVVPWDEFLKAVRSN